MHIFKVKKNRMNSSIFKDLVMKAMKIDVKFMLSLTTMENWKIVSPLIHYSFNDLHS